jgi:transposase
MEKEGGKLSFKGQPIYVGIDVSKKSWQVSIHTEQFEHKTFSAPPDVEVLKNYLHRNFPQADYQCVYEAGFTGYWIYEKFQKCGINCLVVNSADVPTKGKEKVTKNDPTDARKLARAIRSGDIQGIYIPSKQAQQDRSLVRTRQALVRKQRRVKNQIKSFLYFYGIPVDNDIGERYWSRRFINWLEQIQMEYASGDAALKLLLEELHHIREMILRVTRQIRELSRSDRYREDVKNLITIPGISTLTAMVILTELVDINRFKRLDDLRSYVGLIPGEHSSGDKKVITDITMRHNSMLRWVLIESAWVAVRKDPALAMSFNKLSSRMPKNKAIIRIARKLLNRIRYVLKNKKAYQINVVE